jgi:cyclomaltodextrin glucanotransferase
VYQHEGRAQTALVLLNKGDDVAVFDLGERLQPGSWTNPLNAMSPVIAIAAGSSPTLSVGPHDALVWLLDAPVTLPLLRRELDALMAAPHGK